MKGFFQSSVITSKKPESLLPQCGICGIFKSCKSPKMPVTGEGRKGILIVGEAPGETEDDQNVQFIGPAGQELRKPLRALGIDLDRDCWKTNALICRPTKKDDNGYIKNRPPTDKEIGYCRPNLQNTIRKLNPRVIITLGLYATQSVIDPLWSDGVGQQITKWVGWKIPSQKINTWICPTYHPSYILRSKDQPNGKVIKLWFERHLKAAVELEDRPWKEIPDYASQIKVTATPWKVARWLRELIHKGKAISFDLETNCLKPDSDDAEIVCCAVCWNGVKTVAYPWVGEVIEATKELLVSDVPKIGYNVKFESRWIKTKLGIDVNNWVWDGMLSAHHLDNRRGITSAKYQAFVRLGVPLWNEHIEPFLKSTDDSGINRIREIPMRDLLVYCGTDSLVEFLIANIQKKEMLG